MIDIEQPGDRPTGDEPAKPERLTSDDSQMAQAPWASVEAVDEKLASRWLKSPEKRRKLLEEREFWLEMAYRYMRQSHALRGDRGYDRSCILSADRARIKQFYRNQKKGLSLDIPLPDPGAYQDRGSLRPGRSLGGKIPFPGVFALLFTVFSWGVRVALLLSFCFLVLHAKYSSDNAANIAARAVAGAPAVSGRSPGETSKEGDGNGSKTKGKKANRPHKKGTRGPAQGN